MNEQIAFLKIACPLVALITTLTAWCDSGSTISESAPREQTPSIRSSNAAKACEDLIVSGLAKPESYKRIKFSREKEATDLKSNQSRITIVFQSEDKAGAAIKRSQTCLHDKNGSTRLS